MIRVLHGDCRDVLPTLPAHSVHCVVTSPPYYGLRDYGTAQWDGGDAGCDHLGQPMRTNNKPSDSSATFHGGTTRANEWFRAICGKCGARRIDRQIGLEATPDEYIATMVAVFRQIRRVLRDDGTCWVNLGSSYASGDKRPSQSPERQRVLACDSGGTEPLGSRAPDCAYPGRDDECPDGFRSHRDRSADIVQLTPPELPPDAMTSHDSGPLPSSAAQPSLLDVLASTTPSLPRNDLDACGPADEASTSPSEPQTSSAGARAFSRNSCDCGSCGICFARLAIPMLRLKAKDLMMMPELFALALQADGWYVRSSIIWSKPNPMPESVTDRPTSAHEHVFLLTKAARYYYDADAVREEPTGRTDPMGFARGHPPGTHGHTNGYELDAMKGRNLRNVWTIATAPFPEAHFATYPPELAERCIKAGCPPWGTVLDPFAGAGTTMLVADRLQRHAIGIELNANYAAMSRARIMADAPLLAEVAD